jgi:hypothetical protein
MNGDSKKSYPHLAFINWKHLVVSIICRTFAALKLRNIVINN